MKTVKIIKTFLIVAALPLLASAATRRYIVELSTEPAARFASRTFGPHKESLARPEVDTHRATVRTEQDQLAAKIKQLGGRIIARTDTASNTLTVELPEENAAKVAALPGVKDFHKERHFKALLDQANIVHHLPETYGLLAGGASSAGQGMKIGIIDSGIDITQPAFSDAGFVAPAGFPKVKNSSDIAFTNNKVIVARSYVSMLDNQDIYNDAADHNGHGTITGGCAAGAITTFNNSTQSFTGIAPGAYLGSYKVFGTPGYNDSPNDTALLAAIDDAINDGMDVINYSIGSIFPIPLGEDQEASSLNNAYSLGILVTVSSGDEGNGWFPFVGNDGNYYPVSYVSADGKAVTIPAFSNTEGSGNVITVGGSSNQRAFGTSLTVGNSRFLVDTEDAVTTDNNGNALVFNNAPLVDVTTIDGSGQACNSLPANSLNGAIALISINGWDPSTDDCDPATKLNNAANAGAIAGVIYDNLEEDFRNFFDFSNIYGYSYFSGQDGVTPSTNLPGGFITIDDGTAILNILASQSNTTATYDFNYTYGNVVPLSPDRMTFGSSRGPNVSYEIKPEVIAVGEFLLVPSETIDPNGNYYDASGTLFPLDGTSSSAPMVAGAAAILKSARPGLTTDQYRSLLINNAVPIHSCTLQGQWPNCPQARVMDAGAGLMNVLNSMNAEATAVPATLSFGVADGSAAQNKTLTITNTGAAADTFNITVVGRDPGFMPQVSPASLQLGPGQSGTVQVTIPGGVLSAGEYEGNVHIQGANTAVDTHVPYWFGIPSATPYLLVDLGSDIVDTRGQPATEAIVFRITDASRIIMNNLSLNQVSITFKGIDTGSGNITPGTGKVNKIYYDNNYSPGTIGVDVTLDTHRNVYNIYEVKVGGVTFDYYIIGQ